MSRFKEGDRVRIVEREVTDEDRKTNRYFHHMGGMVGTIANVYGPEEIAVQIDLESLPAIQASVHEEATQRMRQKFLESIGEEQKKLLTREELNFDAHYVLLVRSADLLAV